MDFKIFETTLSYLFSRPHEFDATDKKKKTISIFLINRDIQNCRKLAKDCKGGHSLVEKAAGLTHPSQLEAITPPGYRSNVRVVTRSMARRAQNEELYEDEVANDVEIFGSDESDGDLHLGNAATSTTSKTVDPITRPPKESLDVDRFRMTNELKRYMVAADDNPLSQAKMAHALFHLPRTALVSHFGITKTEADKIIANCSCSEALSTNRHRQHPSRSHTRPFGPGVEVSADVMHLDSKAYMLVCRDMYSGLVRLEPIKSLTSDTIFTAFLKLYRSEGLPITLKTDP